MSIEKSLESLAESNNALAKAMTYYAGVIEKNAMNVYSIAQGATPPAADPAPAAPEKPTKPAKAKKYADPPPPASDDDGFGDDGLDDTPANLTADQIKAKLIEVKDAYGDKAPALEIIGRFGYNAIPEVQPKDYAAVWKACNAKIAARG